MALQGSVPLLLWGKNAAEPRGTRAKCPELRLLLHHSPEQSPAGQDSPSPLEKTNSLWIFHLQVLWVWS